MTPSQPHQPGVSLGGTLDGSGAADHDQVYHFGRRPHSAVPHPFSTRQYARLLVLRSRVQAGVFEPDDVTAQ